MNGLVCVIVGNREFCNISVMDYRIDLILDFAYGKLEFEPDVVTLKVLLWVQSSNVTNWTMVFG